MIIYRSVYVELLTTCSMQFYSQFRCIVTAGQVALWQFATNGHWFVRSLMYVVCLILKRD